MPIVLSVIGGGLGSLLLGWPGLVIGLAIGYLIGMVSVLSDRMARLEERVAAQRTTPARPPVQAPSPEASSVVTSTPIPEPQPRAAVPVSPATVEAPTAAGPRRPTGSPTGPKFQPTWHVPPRYEPGAVDRLLVWVKAFFTTGNVVARIGVIVLFFGVAFLLKYAVERNALSIEFRLTGVTVGALVMLVVGWRLRLRRPTYALIVQGGSIGVLYLTVFAAAKLYHLLPLVFAFAVMVALVALSGALAVLQNARGLATFGTAGGFLAPVLISTGTGNHVMLFSYYAVLNAGILGIAWFKAWRELNLVGFAFTFVIGAWWGAESYRPALFATTEPFLVLFFLFYVAIAVLFAHRQPPQLRGYVDGTLVFGVPLVAFALQGALVREIEYGLAVSAVAVSALYLGVATALWRRMEEGLRLLIEAFLALGVVFASVAVPLALDGRWTAAAWALEGAALVWVGVRQHRVTARVFGLLLQVGAGLAFRFAVSDPVGDVPVLNGLYLGCLAISLAALFSSGYLERHQARLLDWEAPLRIPVLAWGLLWWFGAGVHEIHRHAPAADWIDATLVFVAASAAAMEWLARRLAWETMRYPAMGLLPVMAAIALGRFIDGPGGHPFAGWGVIAWAAAFGVQYHLLWRFEGAWGKLLRVWHPATLWLAVFVVTQEGVWAVGRMVGAGTWTFAVWGAAPGLAIAGLLAWGRRIRWPVGRFHGEYLGAGLMPAAVYLWFWGLASNLHAADPSPLSYVPLLNPVDVVQVFAFLVLIRWVWECRRQRFPVLDIIPDRAPMYALAGAVFLWLNAVIARTVHFWGDVPFSAEALHRSVVFHASLSILWSVTAMGVMVGAARAGNREVWSVGGALLGLVVAKLFAVDLAGTGTVARIISFLVVGVLMLLIGYLSPLPPRRRGEAST